MKVMLERADASQKVVGSNPGTGKDFSRGISINVYFYYLVWKSVHLNARDFNVLDLSHVYMWQMYALLE